MKAYSLHSYLIASALLLTTTGCANNALEFAERGFNGEDGDSGGGLPPPERTFDNPPIDRPIGDPVADPVCDPLSAGGNGGSEITEENGLIGALSYLPAEEWSSVHNLSAFWTADSSGSLSAKYPVNATLYSSALNTPTVRFDKGFRPANDPDHPITYPDDRSQVLVEYFSLIFDSELRLRAGQAPGKYQFAILSDDGAVLSSGTQILVNNDGTHAEKLGCSSAHSAVTMNENTKLKIRVGYYQGPRYHISLIVLWRKVSDEELAAQSKADPLCGAGDVNYFFNSDVYPPVAKTPFNDLLARGWEVIPAENYFLPDQITNPCTMASN